MPLILILILFVGCAMAGAWYGRTQERALWTRRLLERGINPNTLYPRGTGMPLGEVEPLQPLDPDADAMRDTMEDMAREVERLVEGQRFLTRVLTERRPTPPPEPDISPTSPDRKDDAS